MIDQEKFYLVLSQPKIDEVKKLTQETLGAGESAETILKEGFIPAMERVGNQFKNGEFFLPEVLLASRNMHASMEMLKPFLSKSTSNLAMKVVIGTVKGDLHDIGKNLVAMMIEGAGFDIIDLGIDVPTDKFIEAIREHKPHVLGMSALLTTTMNEMKNNLQTFEKAGLRKKVKIIIGGAPVTEKFAQEIGADGYAPDAASAVDLVKSILSDK